IWDAIWDPQDKDSFEIDITPENASLTPTFKGQSDLLSSVRGYAENASNRDPEEYMFRVEELRDFIISAIQVFSGSVMRMPELCNLQLLTESNEGKFFPCLSFAGDSTLAFAGFVSKAKRDAFGMFPFWLARLILIFLQVLLPRTFGPLATEMINE